MGTQDYITHIIPWERRTVHQNPLFAKRFAFTFCVHVTFSALYIPLSLYTRAIVRPLYSNANFKQSSRSESYKLICNLYIYLHKLFFKKWPFYGQEKINIQNLWGLVNWKITKFDVFEEQLNHFCRIFKIYINIFHQTQAIKRKNFFLISKVVLNSVEIEKISLQFW